VKGNREIVTVIGIVTDEDDVQERGIEGEGCYSLILSSAQRDYVLFSFLFPLIVVTLTGIYSKLH